MVYTPNVKRFGLYLMLFNKFSPIEVVMLILYERILLWKNMHNVSIYAIEKGANITIGSMKNWKHSMPSGDKILSVANFMDVSVDYLLGNTDNPLSHKSQSNILIDSLVVKNHEMEIKINKLENEIKQYNQYTKHFQNKVQGILDGTIDDTQMDLAGALDKHKSFQDTTEQSDPG